MKFELCAASMEAVKMAGELGFDRIELCQALEQGGLTPSAGMIEYALAFGIETHVLIRPRPGGFFYSEDDIEIIYREIINCKRLGVKGVVVGALTEAGEIDAEILRKMVDLSGEMEVTFHRAFDDAIDWRKSVDLLIESGVTRVLSSGMSSSVDVGFPILKQMVAHAGSQFQIMAGGGVNAGNINRIVKEVQPAAVHFSATVKYQLDEDSLFSESILKFDPAKANRILTAAKV
jgi:copper homeostasis protein